MEKGISNILALRSWTILILSTQQLPVHILKTVQKCTLSLHMMTDSVVLKHGVHFVNCSSLLFQIAHFPLIIFPLLSPGLLPIWKKINQIQRPKNLAANRILSKRIASNHLQKTIQKHDYRKL